MSGAWHPPFRTSEGRYEFGDWRPIRDAIQMALVELNEPIVGMSDRDWNLVGLAMDFHRHNSRYKCVECRKPINQGFEIRCLDCKGPLCETCAPKHFWPNGKPTP